MRLVDADNARECFGGDGVTGAVMQRMFDSLPTIDAVPVVRCKDCKYIEITEETGGRYCHVWGFFNGAGDDGFCNYGKRRDDRP